MNVAQDLKEPQIARQIRFAETTKHSQIADSPGFLRKCYFRLFSCGGAQALPAWTI